MVVITEELIDQLVKEYSEQEGHLPDEDCIKKMNLLIGFGFNIDEKEAINLLKACEKGYENG